MDKQEYIDYYKDLLILQYKGKPKAEAHIALLADIFSMDLLPLKVLSAFDLDEAEGVQLDVVAKYFGVKRTGPILSGLVVSLNDQDLRDLLKIIQITNYTDATYYEMQQLLFQNFGSDIQLFDYLNMRMGYFIYPSIGSNILAQFIVANNLLPSPIGVTISSTIVGYDNAFFYGFVTYSNPVPMQIAPFNDYDTGLDTNNLWLQYSDSVEVPPVEGVTTEDGLASIVSEQNNLIIFEQD